jgi:hypothetical protein
MGHPNKGRPFRSFFGSVRFNSYRGRAGIACSFGVCARTNATDFANLSAGPSGHGAELFFKTRTNYGQYRDDPRCDYISLSAGGQTDYVLFPQARKNDDLWHGYGGQKTSATYGATNAKLR